MHEKERFENVLSLLRRKEETFAVNAKDKFSQIDSQAAYEAFLRNLHHGQSNEISNQWMAICIADLGKSVGVASIYDGLTFAGTERLALHRDQVISGLADIVFHETLRVNGTLFIPRGGDQLVYGFGVDPKYSDIEDSVYRALDVNYRIRDIVDSLGSTGFKDLWIARKFDIDVLGRILDINTITIDDFRRYSDTIDDILGEKSETGESSKIQFSVGIGVGPCKATFKTFHQMIGGLGGLIPILDVTGDGANIAGRAESVAGNGEIVLAYVDNTIKHDKAIHVEGLVRDENVKGWEFTGYRMIGAKTYNRPFFDGKIPENDHWTTFMDTYRKMVDGRYKQLKNISVLHKIPKLDLPAEQRKTIKHGYALIAASIVASIVSKNNYASGEFSVDTLMDFALVDRIGEYLVEDDQDLVRNPNTVKLERKNRRIAVEATAGYGYLHSISEYQDTPVPDLVLRRNDPFTELREKYGKSTALGIQLVAMAEDWVETVSALLLKKPEDALSKTLELISAKYEGSPWLPAMQETMRLA